MIIPKTLITPIRADSLHLMYSGSANEFIEALKYEVHQHPALQHSFLIKLSRGEFSNTKAVLRDYAHQYSFYSAWFTRYLSSVISNLDSEKHTSMLLHNMDEEKGIRGSSNMEEWPHVKLFDVFKSHVGADAEYCRNTPACTTVLLWRDLFLQKCNSKIEGVGIAAIGLATEYIISRIYPYIIEGIESHTDLGPEASMFFRLHVDCDDDHAAEVELIAREIAEDISTREAIRFGVFSSLNLRKAFWDTQLVRAERLS